MRIAIGCDDTGLALKEALVAALEADGHDVLDLGTFSTDPVDYPDYARAVGQAVLRGFVDASLLLCASGTGGGGAGNKKGGAPPGRWPRPPPPPPRRPGPPPRWSRRPRWCCRTRSSCPRWRRRCASSSSTSSWTACG